ncbi:hypothetical protein ACHAXS_007440 [Conticribra weissflogii]
MNFFTFVDDIYLFSADRIKVTHFFIHKSNLRCIRSPQSVPSLRRQLNRSLQQKESPVKCSGAFRN